MEKQNQLTCFKKSLCVKLPRKLYHLCSNVYLFYTYLLYYRSLYTFEYISQWYQSVGFTLGCHNFWSCHYT